MYLTAHLTKVKNGWKLTIVNGIKPLLENIILEQEFATKTYAKRTAKQIGAKPWNYI
jgi:hypothetical protein